MGKKDITDVLQRNVAIMAGHTAKEDSMMPATGAPLPSVEEVKRIVQLVKVIIFTDYFHKRQANERMRSYIIGVNMEELYELLRRQIACGLQFCTECGCDAEKQADELALRFIDELPEIKRLLYTDVEAMFDNDPAAQTYGEVIFSYPVVNTMTHYRIAHVLHQMEIPILPRIITEQAHSKTGIDIHPGASIGEYFAIDHGTGVVIGETCIIGNHVTLYQGVTLGRIITEQAHSKTGIDIHPGAKIGEYFAIDHGTGVVIGETCIIGNHVTLYQGVTLGAKSFKYDANGNMLNVPRHPIIEDYVTIYSNASILGRITIGHHSIIGGNIWVVNNVPPHSRIQQSKAVDLSFQGGLGI